MIALAAIVSAVVVQAASVDWNTSGTVFDWTNFMAPEGTIAFYEASNMDTALATLTLDGDGGWDGIVSGTDQANWIARITITNFDGGGSYFKDYAFYMDTVTHAGSPDAATYLASLSGTIASDFGGTLDLMASPADQGFTAAVPEPTSGLLILLGMAGLALKRKRA